MKVQTSEWCAVGHPDRTCDYIASYILDRHLEMDPYARVALEVQLKDAHCTVSGEVTSQHTFTDGQLADFCRRAVEEIGYTEDYQRRHGAENCIKGADLEVVLHISRQSPDIAQGVDADGWGDQGIFWGMAVNRPETGYMPLDCHLARELAQNLVKLGYGGIDVKTQVTVHDGKPVRCVVAVPVLPASEESAIGSIRNYVKAHVGEGCDVVVNGTGRYVRHGSVGDCGTTGRKLVVDAYGGNARIGGGSYWGKDPSKADVTLNVYARRLALDFLRERGLDEVHCAICCCIGRRRIDIAFFDGSNRLLETRVEDEPASRVIERLGLREPRYAERCAKGLFGHED